MRYKSISFFAKRYLAIAKVIFAQGIFAGLTCEEIIFTWCMYFIGVRNVHFIEKIPSSLKEKL